MYDQTIERGANIVHGEIGEISCCNNALVSIRSIFCIDQHETTPCHPGWTIVQLGSSEIPIPSWTIDSTIDLSLQISLSPPLTTVPC